MRHDARRSSYGRSPLGPNPGDLRPAVGHLVSNPSSPKPRRSDDDLAALEIIQQRLRAVRKLQSFGTGRQLVLLSAYSIGSEWKGK
jgi:hypothetical protein